MRATPPARALSWTIDFLDRFWGPVVLCVVAVLEVSVFAPRGMTVAMLAGGAVAAGAMAVWLFDSGG